MRAPLTLAAALAALLLAAASARALSPFFIFFDTGSARLGAQAGAILDNAASATRAMEPEAIEIEGHADRPGAASYNLRLSRRRAEAVKAELVARGVRPGLITIVAHGEARPLVDTADGVAEPQNRYVAIIFRQPCVGPSGVRYC